MTTTEFGQDRVFVHGQWHTPSRKTCAFGDNGLTYRCSGMERESKPYTKVTLALKEYMERICDCKFNYILAQHYPDGNSYISPHGDKLIGIKRPVIIASLTINEGASRDFIIKNKQTGDNITLTLDDGALIIMKGERIQKEYVHSVPVRKRITTGRINLTFRQIE